MNLYCDYLVSFLILNSKTKENILLKLTYRFYRLFHKVKSRVGYRTLKTAVATPLSMAVAQSFGVTNVATAGILAILCIQPSRKQSFKIASERFLACLLAIAFSAMFFEVLGYSALVLSLLLIVFIPTSIFLKLESGILTSTVITLNIYLFENFNLSFISNQLYLIIIGIGTGFLVNLYMPSLDKQLDNLKKSVEVRFQIILEQFSQIIRQKETNWKRGELLELEALFKEATTLVRRDKENQMSVSKHSYYDYFEMRKHQFEILKEILLLVERIPKEEAIGEEIAAFIVKIGKAVPTGDTAAYYLKELEGLREKFKEISLPKTYEDFETKSVLLELLYEIERYLTVKRNLMQPKEKPVQKTS